jgi:preprotein translocase subunit YajC
MRDGAHVQRHSIPGARFPVRPHGAFRRGFALRFLAKPSMCPATLGWRDAGRFLFGLEKSVFITPAFAQGAAAAPGASSILIQLVPFVLIFVIMYFLLIRPQQKRQKAHQEMIKNVRRGDQVVLGGGLVGKVSKDIDDAHVEVEIADNVKVKVVRSTILDVRSKAEPVKS